MSLRAWGGRAEEHNDVAEHRDQVAAGLVGEFGAEFLAFLFEGFEADFQKRMMRERLVDRPDEFWGEALAPEPENGLEGLRLGFELAAKG